MVDRPATKTDRKRTTKVAVGRLGVFAWLIFGFLAMPQGAAMNILVVIGFVTVALTSIVLIVLKYRNPARSSPNIYVEIIYYLAVFIVMFSVLYWVYGERTNFNIQLTRWDALYFTVGTLSTAGTGNIVATSELARGLQGLQMLLDLGFVLVAVTLVVTRLASVKTK